RRLQAAHGVGSGETGFEMDLHNAVEAYAIGDTQAVHRLSRLAEERPQNVTRVTYILQLRKDDRIAHIDHGAKLHDDARRRWEHGDARDGLCDGTALRNRDAQ